MSPAMQGRSRRDSGTITEVQTFHILFGCKATTMGLPVVSLEACRRQHPSWSWQRAKRVGVAQIALYGEGQLGDVFKDANILGREARRSARRVRKSSTLPPGQRKHGPQAPQLQLTEFPAAGM